MSIIQNEVAGLVGAYIRAWIYGGIVGAILASWLILSQPADLSLEQPANTFTPHQLPCWERECLEAFEYTVANEGGSN